MPSDADTTTRWPRRRVKATRSLLVGLVSALTAFAVLLGAPAVEAADGGDFTVSPYVAKGSQPRDYIVISAAPGRAVADAVSVANPTKTTQRFTLHAADAYNTETGGALTVRDREEPQEGIGAWTTLPTRTLTVPPGTRVPVPFIIRVPVNAQPGDYVGGVVAVNTAVQRGAPTGSTRVAIRRQVAARVYLRVTGELTPGLQVRAVSIDRSGREATVRYTLLNSGNVRLSPRIAIAATGVTGRVLHEFPDTLVADLLPGQEAEFTSAWGQLPLVDYATVTVDAVADGAADTGTAHQLIFPWWWLLLLIIPAVVWAVRRARRRLARSRHVSALPTAEVA